MSKLFQPQYIKQLCKKCGLAPGRKYGQNFLVNPEPLEKMLQAGEVSAGDTVAEVGPGFGALTLALATRAKTVIAFEIEKKLEPYWREIRKTHKNIEIVWGNVLRGAKLPEGPYKVVANIPYQITSNLIRTFLESENPPRVMILMVQKEVAERICAKPGEMSLLSVSVQYFADAEKIMPVPRSYFWPEPSVDSAIIRIGPRLGGKKDEFDRFFFRTVRAGFASRRKILLKNLEAVADKKNRRKLEEIFDELGLDTRVRAQELSVRNWLDLAGELSTYLSAKTVV